MADPLDFGTLHVRAGTVHGTIPVRNTTNAYIVVESARISCDYMSIESEFPFVVPPGESSEISVALDTSRMYVGENRYNVSLRVRDGQTVQANALYRFEPLMEISEVPVFVEEQGRPVEVRLTSSVEDAEIASATSSDERLKARLGPAGEDQEGAFTTLLVWVEANEPLHSFDTTIKIEPRHAGVEAFELPVRVRLQAGITARPGVVLVDELGMRPVDREVIISHPESLEPMTVTSDSPLVIARAERVEPGVTRLLLSIAPPDDPTGALLETVVTVTVQEVPVLQIPVIARTRDAKETLR
jgi:hypothetical protein